MFIRFLGLGALAMALTIGSTNAAEVAKKGSVLGHSVKAIDGNDVELSKYEGKVILIVNVASKCGYTPQYTGLQDLHEKYKDKGLVVLGVPCNQFGSQEPGSNKEIQEFCSSKYKVTFDMLDKVDVNGAKASPLFKQLTDIDAKPKGKGDVKWNFEKFLVNRNGELVGRFPSSTKPESAELVSAIETALAQK